MKGLILAGGHGTRLRPLTHTGPKQLIPIANKPNILYAVEDLRDAGVKEIGIILGTNMPEKVCDLLGDGAHYGVRITYIVQGDPKGIAHAVACSKEFMGDEPFAVYLGDNILKGGIRAMVSAFERSDAASSIALCEVPDPQRFGVAVLDGTGRVVKTIEKPKVPPSPLAVIGIYLFRKEVFDVIAHQEPSWRGELEITDAIQRLIDRGKRVDSHIVTGWWKDTGKPEDILDANHLVLDDLVASDQGTREEGVEVQGRVAIGPGTVLKKGALVRGPVIIGANCTIGPGTYVGPYTSIGDNTTIIGGEIEASIVIGDSHIECGKRIVHSLVGRGARLLSAATVRPQGVRLIVGENSTVNI